MTSRSPDQLMLSDQTFKAFSRKNIVFRNSFHTNVVAQQTARMRGSFISVNADKKLPDDFFGAFLANQGLRLKGAEDIKVLRTKGLLRGPCKERMEDLITGFETGDVLFELVRSMTPEEEDVVDS
jgi:hypothetical protein